MHADPILELNQVKTVICSYKQTNKKQLFGVMSLSWLGWLEDVLRHTASSQPAPHIIHCLHGDFKGKVGWQ